MKKLLILAVSVVVSVSIAYNCNVSFVKVAIDKIFSLVVNNTTYIQNITKRGDFDTTPFDYRTIRIPNKDGYYVWSVGNRDGETRAIRYATEDTVIVKNMQVGFPKYYMTEEDYRKNGGLIWFDKIIEENK